MTAPRAGSSEADVRPLRALAAAHLLCASYKRHKPTNTEYSHHRFRFCDRCWQNASSWEDWISRAERLADRMYG